MKQIKVLYNDLSVGFFILNDSLEIMEYGFHITDESIIENIKTDYPVGTQIELSDNYYRVYK